MIVLRDEAVSTLHAMYLVAAPRLFYVSVCWSARLYASTAKLIKSVLFPV